MCWIATARNWVIWYVWNCPQYGKPILLKSSEMAWNGHSEGPWNKMDYWCWLNKIEGWCSSYETLDGEYHSETIRFRYAYSGNFRSCFEAFDKNQSRHHRKTPSKALCCRCRYTQNLMEEWSVQDWPEDLSKFRHIKNIFAQVLRLPTPCDF